MRRLAGLLFTLVLASCSGEAGAAPNLPLSVTPGWRRSSLVKTSDECWKADYVSDGTAFVNVCRYSSEAVALDHAQRAHSEPDTVNFQQGKAFVVVHWKSVSQAEVTSLVRAVQKGLTL